MATSRYLKDDPGSDHVLVTNAAANMVTSLHPYDRSKAKAALTMIKSSVLDPARVKRIIGVDNAFVARAGRLQVVFRKEGGSFVITSVIAKA